MSGSVKNVTDFGAFVDLGDCDGLIHKTRMGRRRNDHPSEVFTVGEEVSVMVVSVDVERERVSLALNTF
ncbi:30S ribosomal protein S1 [Mycobacterium tuberculosis]|nr:30S ribosomal protein S1 [Mycobacterium tuberculosis]